jgi:hypothetical protein
MEEIKLNLVWVVWIGWIFSGLVWFTFLKRSLAVSISVVGAAVLIPCIDPDVQLQIGSTEFEFTKHHAASLTLLVGLASSWLLAWFRSKSPATDISNIKIRSYLWDLPMLLFCVIPIATVLSLGQSIDEGLILSLDLMLHWGIPFWVARRTFVDLATAADLMLVVMILGLLYVPICLYEIVVGPKYYLQYSLFGVDTMTDAGHTFRMGGWRPHGMMGNGIRLGRWMTVATLVTMTVAIASIPRRDSLPLRSGMPQTTIWIATAVLFVTTLLTKSFSWLYILAIGMVALFVFSPALIRRRICCTAIGLSCVMTLGVMTVRMLDLVDPSPVVRLVERFSSRAAQSLNFRLKSERLFSDMTLQSSRRWLGNNLQNDFIYPYYSDQRYMMNLKRFGLVGLSLWISTLVIPMLFATWNLWRANIENFPSIVTFLWCFLAAAILWDCLFNAFVNPIFLVGCGLLTNTRQKQAPITSPGVYRLIRPSFPTS